MNQLYEKYTYDDLDFVDVQIGAEAPPWGKAPPGWPISPVKGMTRVILGDQRTVKAGVRL